jgi:hypothetical protein
MSDDLFSPIYAILGDITHWSETLSTYVDDSWNEEQQKLLEIIRISAHNPARWLTVIPNDPHELNVWKHDALSPIIAITGAAELLVEDFELLARPEHKRLSQQIYDASVRARELVIEIADTSIRQTPKA